MDQTNHLAGPPATRREFLKTSAAVAAGGALAAAVGGLPAVHAAGSDVIKVGIIGCGGRGSGAGENVLEAAKGVEIIAVGDYFAHRAQGCRRRLISFAGDEPKVKQLGNTVTIPEDHCYAGLDAYKRVIETPGVNYIILATPPGFRPQHLKAAVAAGKHIFTEKPVATDGPGIRTCFEVYEQANQKKLCIVAGTQRRHQLGYLETIKRIHDGAIGPIVSARCYWNTGNIWFRPREKNQSELDYQIHNWYHFVWLCGDHIVEQHVHNLDVINWATGKLPQRALGMGGRVRPCTNPQVDGHIYNFFAVEYEYPDGLHVLSMCRQINGTDTNFPGIGGVSEALVGTKGTCQVNAYTINGQPVLSRQEAKRATNPYVQEHTDLIEAIRSGKPVNELKSVTESTLTAIMGRMSAYTGKVVSWEQALHSKERLVPEELTPSTVVEIPPVAVPGKTPLV